MGYIKQSLWDFSLVIFDCQNAFLKCCLLKGFLGNSDDSFMASLQKHHFGTFSFKSFSFNGALICLF